MATSQHRTLLFVQKICRRTILKHRAEDLWRAAATQERGGNGVEVVAEQAETEVRLAKLNKTSLMNANAIKEDIHFINQPERHEATYLDTIALGRG